MTSEAGEVYEDPLSTQALFKASHQVVLPLGMGAEQFRTAETCRWSTEYTTEIMVQKEVRNSAICQRTNNTTPGFLNKQIRSQARKEEKFREEK